MNWVHLILLLASPSMPKNNLDPVLNNDDSIIPSLTLDSNDFQNKFLDVVSTNADTNFIDVKIQYFDFV